MTGAKLGGQAAQYVRMSTDHQKYSTQNQSDAIAAYAALHNLTIVRTYADQGRSGLRLDGRDALKTLISDVRTGNADFECILVYDVSRWGRFQDADESAYYEFICREAGIQVHYCAEQFENDGSLASTILKSMKRAMAGEYSRELSAKVFMGQCRIVTLGFFRGGNANYGLRREMLDETGRPKAILQRGQRKNLQTDRVILRPRPPTEIKLVNRIFSSFVIQKKLGTEIATELNAERISSPYGKQWSVATIHEMLENQSYLGHCVFNRTSFKLQQMHVRNPPEMWIRRENAFKAIIDPELFAKAQKILSRRRRRMTDQEALDRLRALWQRKGNLSEKIIKASGRVPSSSTYIHRFGSVAAAYERIGFRPEPRHRFAESKAKVIAVIGSVTEEIIRTLEKCGGCVAFCKKTHRLTINQTLTVSVRVGWSYGFGNVRRWQLRGHAYSTPRVDLTTDMALVLKMAVSNATIQEYYLLPSAQLTLTKDHKLRMIQRVFPDALRHENLEGVCGALITARQPE
jgi:DNA invertase Pin-like site-specific DNA recombinase